MLRPYRSRYGRRRGGGLRERAASFAVAGLVGGYAVHTALGVAGLAVLVATAPVC